MLLRSYFPEDCPKLIQLFVNTVHHTNKADYSPAQLNAWTSNIDAAKWANTLQQHHTIVAEVNGVIAGFGDLDANYIDRLYIHKNFQKQGIAKSIVLSLEETAKQSGEKEITTHASITAKAFFEKLGYQTITQQTVRRNGVDLTNFVMVKPLY